ncbi:hypothetical protein DWV13_05450 [Clostridium botulinum]|uniref:lactococcin G-alpha/enterocin 1071A family bacteriocin n=1 Tax=Clostridium TaxID=1485 RepID=UPI0013F8178D|nr:MULTISPECIES: lactococcin G-alpha/enterocin 1071A family bacteriocin [Clostridium]MCS6131090.1 hypothetical protein [Clostridium botulinum]NFL45362.1 hypothetical protein [Clostridium botulinum]NFL90420.1 hypothetical protein [Clostridium botulinum]
MKNNEFASLTESEMLVINGGGFFSEAGKVVGKGLAYAAHGLSATSTATQTRWVRENSKRK